MHKNAHVLFYSPFQIILLIKKLFQYNFKIRILLAMGSYITSYYILILYHNGFSLCWIIGLSGWYRAYTHRYTVVLIGHLYVLSLYLYNTVDLEDIIDQQSVWKTISKTGSVLFNLRHNGFTEELDLKGASKNSLGIVMLKFYYWISLLLFTLQSHFLWPFSYRRLYGFTTYVPYFKSDLTQRVIYSIYEPTSYTADRYSVTYWSLKFNNYIPFNAKSYSPYYLFYRYNQECLSFIPFLSSQGLCERSTSAFTAQGSMDSCIQFCALMKSSAISIRTLLCGLRAVRSLFSFISLRLFIVYLFYTNILKFLYSFSIYFKEVLLDPYSIH